MTDRCKAKVFRGYHYSQCGNAAKRDGFCGIHHPDAVDRRRAERKARVDAKVAAMLRRREEVDQTRRDAAIGAAVRKALGALDADRCDRIATDAFDGRIYEADRRGFGHLLRVVAAALREEKP